MMFEWVFLYLTAPKKSRCIKPQLTPTSHQFLLDFWNIFEDILVSCEQHANSLLQLQLIHFSCRFHVFSCEPRRVYLLKLEQEWVMA